MVRTCGVLTVRAVVVLGILAGSWVRVDAQVPGVTATSPATSAYMSASGALAVGFTSGAVDTSIKRDAASILPRGSQLAAPAKQLVERMWRVSPTFRRQCARLVEGSVEIIVSFDHPLHNVGADAETLITRGPGLRAHVHLRAADTSSAEHLAHEIEHVLEQLDEVDLTLAVADRVHGAKQVERPGAFETSRAIAIGEQVAREVRDGSGWR
jgi:hypothetical protein